LYETLLTKEEYVHAVDMGNFFRVPSDTRDMNYDKFFVDGDKKIAGSDEYNSNNTQQLSIKEIKEKLMTLDYVQKELKSYQQQRSNP